MVVVMATHHEKEKLMRFGLLGIFFSQKIKFIAVEK